MKRPMTKFRVDQPKVEKHSFVPVRYGTAYAEYGRLKTYANHAQAKKKCEELNAIGFNVSYTMSCPFLIVPIK